MKRPRQSLHSTQPKDSSQEPPGRGEPITNAARQSLSAATLRKFTPPRMMAVMTPKSSQPSSVMRITGLARRGVRFTAATALTGASAKPQPTPVPKAEVPKLRKAAPTASQQAAECSTAPPLDELEVPSVPHGGMALPCVDQVLKRASALIYAARDVHELELPASHVFKPSVQALQTTVTLLRCTAPPLASSSALHLKTGSNSPQALISMCLEQLIMLGNSEQHIHRLRASRSAAMPAPRLSLHLCNHWHDHCPSQQQHTSEIFTPQVPGNSSERVTGDNGGNGPVDVKPHSAAAHPAESVNTASVSIEEANPAAPGMTMVMTTPAAAPEHIMICEHQQGSIADADGMVAGSVVSLVVPTSRVMPTSHIITNQDDEFIAICHDTALQQQEFLKPSPLQLLEGMTNTTDQSDLQGLEGSCAWGSDNMPCARHLHNNGIDWDMLVHLCN